MAPKTFWLLFFISVICLVVKGMSWLPVVLILGGAYLLGILVSIIRVKQAMGKDGAFEFLPLSLVQNEGDPGTGSQAFAWPMEPTDGAKSAVQWAREHGFTFIGGVEMKTGDKRLWVNGYWTAPDEVTSFSWLFDPLQNQEWFRFVYWGTGKYVTIGTDDNLQTLCWPTLPDTLFQVFPSGCDPKTIDPSALPPARIRNIHYIESLWNLHEKAVAYMTENGLTVPYPPDVNPLDPYMPAGSGPARAAFQSRHFDPILEAICARMAERFYATRKNIMSHWFWSLRARHWITTRPARLVNKTVEELLHQW